MNKGNLLTEPLIRTRRGEEIAHRTLPGVLAAMAGGEVDSFPALQPHQEHAWHAFLTQLAAIALHKAGQTAPPVAEGVWRDLLRALTPEWEDDAPWTLLVEALDRPAFLQPPVPEGTLSSFDGPIATPDRLDVLILSRNHDIKVERIHHPQDEHWLLALISLQTMEGFLGAGNWGISRMNGGFASRPGVGFVPGGGVSRRFLRDLGVMLGQEPAYLDAFRELYPDPDGVALVWLLPWDGQSSLPMTRLHPFYLEICRRIRMQRVADGSLRAFKRATVRPRIDGKALQGVTGDVWAPIRMRGGEASLTLSEKGFDYRLLRELLFLDGYRPAPAQTRRPGDEGGELFFDGRGLVRGQGETAGFHQRRIPIPGPIRPSLFALSAPDDPLRKRSQEQVEDAGKVASQILKPSLLTLIQGAPEKLKFDDQRGAPWLGVFDRKVDEAFFPHLWQLPDFQDGEEHLQAWIRFLEKAAFQVFREACGALPIPMARRYRVVARAELFFQRAFAKHYGAFLQQGRNDHGG